jgi:NADH-quinone oxidoreductase subunit N
MNGHLFTLLAPELIVTAGAVIVLLVGLSASERGRGATRFIALASVFAAFLVTWYNGPGDPPVELAGMRFAPLAWYIRLIALSVGALVLLVNWHLAVPAERGDLFAMILFSLAGLLLTSLADDLVLLFLAVELVSIPSYILVSIGRSDIRAQEAGLKYFFLGALSAALLVYGFSFLYGAAGTTEMSSMHFSGNGGFVTLGLLLAFAGLAFKMAAAPFHVYAADVYQGAASPVTGLLGFFPKAAGFVALIKLLFMVHPAGLSTGGWNLPPAAFVFLWIVAAATMTLGNVLGLMQTNVKRMLAYSSVAHSGYMLVGLLAGPVAGGGLMRDGLSAMLFYLVVYGVMNLGAFAVLALIEARGRPVEELDELAGLGRREPLAALALAICVFSLMGIPPTAGFFGKVYVFGAALSNGLPGARGTALIVLAVIGVVNAAIAAGYYLRIVGACYLRDPVAEPTAVARGGGIRLGLLGCCVAVMVVGVWPDGLLKMSQMPFYELGTPPALALQGAEKRAPALPAGQTEEVRGVRGQDSGFRKEGERGRQRDGHLVAGQGHQGET